PLWNVCSPNLLASTGAIVERIALMYTVYTRELYAVQSCSRRHRARRARYGGEHRGKLGLKVRGDSSYRTAATPSPSPRRRPGPPRRGAFPFLFLSNGGASIVAACEDKRRHGTAATEIKSKGPRAHTKTIPDLAKRD